MNLFAFVIAAWLLGLLTGVPVVPLFQKIGRIGRSLFVCVNPRTKAIAIKWARSGGGVADFKFADDTPKSVVLDGPLTHTHRGRSAFLVNTEAGLAFNVETIEPFQPEKDTNGKVNVVPEGMKHEGMTIGTPGKNRTPHLNGARLNAVRKDIRVQQIAASNRMDFSLIAKVVLMGMLFLGLMGVATLWILSGIAKHHGG